MNTLLTLYLAGMPLSLAFILWCLQGLPSEDWVEVNTLTGLAAIAAWVILWPVFLAISVYDVWSEGEP